MRLSILFDNVPGREDLIPLWGFSCSVESGGTRWLFDTGSNGRVLLANAEKMGVDLSVVDALILSHPHWDHVGGVDSVLEVAPEVRLFVPDSLSKHWIADLRRMSGGVEVTGEAPRMLFDDVWSTGVMGEIGEQSVVVATEKGPIVLTGCAHPGIVAITARAVEMTGRAPYLVMGGFHLLNSSRGGRSKG
jgi:7,8-dihydropterin-6-yl-methyl-4-(beta-D-ribofuranosyl)aminobenzene 5'-phosphate synthase